MSIPFFITQLLASLAVGVVYFIFIRLICFSCDGYFVYLIKENHMYTVSDDKFDFDAFDCEIMQKRVMAHYIYSINETVIGCYSPKLKIGYVRAETSRYTKIFRFKATCWDEFKQAIRLYPL